MIYLVLTSHGNLLKRIRMYFYKTLFWQEVSTFNNCCLLLIVVNTVSYDMFYSWRYAITFYYLLPRNFCHTFRDSILVFYKLLRSCLSDSHKILLSNVNLWFVLSWLVNIFLIKTNVFGLIFRNDLSLSTTKAMTDLHCIWLRRMRSRYGQISKQQFSLRSVRAEKRV